MNRYMAAALAATAFGISGAASAQMRVEEPIKAGTPVVLSTVGTLVASDPSVKVGRSFPLVLSQAVVTDGHQIVPAGTTATATIVSIDAPKAGHEGRIVARLQDLRYGTHRIRLAGGLEGTGMGSATIPSGLSVRGYIDEDVAVDPPVVVVVTAPPPGPVPAENVMHPKPTVEIVTETAPGASQHLATRDGPDGARVVMANGAPPSARRAPLVISNMGPEGSVVVSKRTRTTTVANSDGETMYGRAESSTMIEHRSTSVRHPTPHMPSMGVARDATVTQGGVVTRYTY